jgi:hypothetical protein
MKLLLKTTKAPLKLYPTITTLRQPARTPVRPTKIESPRRASRCKVLARQDPALLLQILGDAVAAWSELSLRQAQFLSSSYAA